MTDWFQETFLKGHGAPFDVLALRLAFSFVFGCIVAGIYHLTQGKPRAETSSFVATLVLLTILIAMVTIVIGDNSARAFSLVGALAIIRFRTVVEDTRDTAFVIFAVVVGMTAGAGFLAVAALGIPIVAFAALMLNHWGQPSRAAATEAQLHIRVGLGQDPESLLGDLFLEYLGHARLTSTSTAKQGAALDVTYAVRLRPETKVISLIYALNKREGVQSVELSQ